MNESRVRAPQLPSDPDRWLNTGGKAVSLADLKGCVVLLDFWTYGCINCLHVLPDIKYLEAKYAKRPFIVIGVHSGKYDNEKDGENIRSALLRHDIQHPVVQDNDYRVWQEYDAHAWPTFVVLDPDGYYVGSISGEGHRDTLDAFIGGLLDTTAQGREIRRIALLFAPESLSTPDTPLRFPGKLLADPLRERLYIADSGHDRIIACDLDGLRAQILGSGEAGRADGSGEAARFRRPQGMALVGDALFVCDCDNHLLRRMDLQAQTVTTVAGTGAQAAPRQGGGTGLKTPLSSPWDICYNQAEHGLLYVAMAGAHQIWRYDLHTGNILPIAGSGREARIDGSGDKAAFAQPSGLCADGSHLYVADSETGSIRRVTLPTALSDETDVETLAGGDLFDWGDVDGPGGAARLQHPLGVCCHAGRVYIADTYNHKIKTLDPLTGEVTTLAGTGRRGLANGPASQAQFCEPAGISAAGGKLYIADTNNHTIRVLDLESQAVSTLEIAGVRAPNVCVPPTN